MKGLLEEDVIVQQNVISNHALVRMDKIKELEELIRENERLSSKISYSPKMLFTERLMWFFFGTTFTGVLI